LRVLTQLWKNILNEEYYLLGYNTM
jgi:hypothetical protein